MNQTKIIDKIAREKVVENLVNKLKTEDSSHLDDLCQDIYISLLEKDASLIERLYSDDELNFYIVAMIRNNLCSSTSPFYKKYVKFSQHLNLDDLLL